MIETHVAQINIGVMVAATDDPAVAEFMNGLDRINAQADAAEGFIWRLQTESGNATDIQIFPNPLQLVNMSVWESVDTLKTFVYRTEHVDFFRRRAEWFETDAKQVALWSVAPGTVPDLADAVRRVEFLERHGPTPYAFGFANRPAPLWFEVSSLADAEMRAMAARSNLETTPGDGRLMVSARFDGAMVGFGLVPAAGALAGRLDDVYVEPEHLHVRAALVDQLELAAGVAV